MLSCEGHIDGLGEDRVNSIIGNIGVLKVTGCQTLGSGGENALIRAHLKYVEDLLRNREVDQLGPETRKRRREMLDYLHEYWLQGSFPQNFDFPEERRPCFIDKSGNICAVGYLIERSAGRELAEKINSEYKYDRIYDIVSPELAKWLNMSGLTLDECAMIQPQYNGKTKSSPNYPYIDGYVVITTLLTSANLTTSIINANQINRHPENTNAVNLGMFLGLTQTTMGVVRLEQKDNVPYNYFNLGMGLTTMAICGYNYYSNSRPTDKRSSWLFYGYPMDKDRMGLGFYYSRRF